jgi:hypothetical protein
MRAIDPERSPVSVRFRTIRGAHPPDSSELLRGDRLGQQECYAHRCYPESNHNIENPVLPEQIRAHQKGNADQNSQHPEKPREHVEGNQESSVKFHASTLDLNLLAAIVMAHCLLDLCKCQSYGIS